MSLLKKAGDNYDPNKVGRLIIASRPGTGKTSSLMDLPDSIFFDLEGSSSFFKGKAMIADIPSIMADNNIGMLTAIKNVIAEIKKEKISFKFVVIDTLTKINELAEKVATVKYKNSTQGKDFKGGSVLELSYGLGYGLLRNEFEEIVNLFDEIGAESVIFSCHIKDSSIPKDSDNIAVTDLNLTGSLKEIFTAKQDASCIMEIHDDNKNVRVLNFLKTDNNNMVKCRAEHLSNKKVIVSEKTKDGLKTYWENIFLNLNK